MVLTNISVECLYVQHVNPKAIAKWKAEPATSMAKGGKKGKKIRGSAGGQVHITTHVSDIHTVFEVLTYHVLGVSLSMCVC